MGETGPSLPAPDPPPARSRRSVASPQPGSERAHGRVLNADSGRQCMTLPRMVAQTRPWARPGRDQPDVDASVDACRPGYPSPIKVAATVAPNSQTASVSFDDGSPTHRTGAATSFQPSPFTMRSIPLTAPSTSSFP